MVLVSPRNPLNIGAAARAMSNFGCLSLRLVNAYEVAFREARSAVGAGALLRDAREYPDVAAAVSDCSLVVGTTSLGRREPQHPLRRLDYGARLMRKHMVGGRAALLFGSEKFGLSNEDMSHCHWLMRIPTRAAHESMNLGQAVAVCLYEVARGARPVEAPPKPSAPASAGELERITTLWLELLTESGYVNPRTAASTTLKTRRLLRRLGFRASDTETWLGMLRQVQWRMKQGG